MNIKISRRKFITYGAGSTTGKYVRINSSLKSNGNNSYTVTVKLSTSSSQVYNAYGIKVYAVIGGVSHHLGTPTISNGTFSGNNYTKTFTVSSTVSVYARCICLACENGTHNVDKDKFVNQTSADTATYVNPTVIPNKPNPNLTWANSSKLIWNGEDVYKGTIDSSTNMNKTTFKCGMPGNAVTVYLYLEKYVNPNWVAVNTTIIKTATDSYTYTYSNSDRGFSFRLKSKSVSKTDHQVWGDIINWRLNDSPEMDANKVKFNLARTTNHVTLSWEHFSDTLNQNNHREYRVHLYKWNGSDYYSHKSFDVGNTTSTSFNLSDHGYEKGEWCKASIEPRDMIEWAYKSYGSPQVRRNTEPYFSTGTVVNSSVDSSVYNKVFKDSFDVSWNIALDNEGDTLTYNLYYRAQHDNGTWQTDWTLIHSNITSNSRSKTIHCQNYVSKGKSIIIAVQASDGLSNSGLITSQTLTRDSNPSNVTGITLNPVQNNEHYEYINYVHWNAVNGLNGKACKYIVEMIECREKNVNTVVNTTRKETTATRMDSFTIVNIRRGYYFYFRVYAEDMHGLTSTDWNNTGWFKKNMAPNAPANFKVIGDKLNFYQSVPMRWDQAYDPENDTITYKIYCSYNKGSYNEIANNIRETTYTHNISNRNPGDTLGYKIIAIDQHGVMSGETYISNNHLITVNIKPTPPKLMYPQSALYDKTPRLLFDYQGDANKESVIVKIVINGQSYNSATSSAFNKTNYSNTDYKIVFIPPSLNVGNNTIKIKSNDGSQDSDEATFNVEYREPLLYPLTANHELIITSDIYNKLIKMIDASRIAYKYGNFRPNIPVVNETLITSEHWHTLYNTVVEITNWINNNYPGKNRNKSKPNITKGNYIYKDIVNNILEIITNL